MYMMQNQRTNVAKIKWLGSTAVEQHRLSLAACARSQSMTSQKVSTNRGKARFSVANHPLVVAEREIDGEIGEGGVGQHRRSPRKGELIGRTASSTVVLPLPCKHRPLWWDPRREAVAHGGVNLIPPWCIGRVRDGYREGKSMLVEALGDQRQTVSDGRRGWEPRGCGRRYGRSALLVVSKEIRWGENKRKGERDRVGTAGTRVRRERGGIDHARSPRGLREFPISQSHTIQTKACTKLKSTHFTQTIRDQTPSRTLPSSSQPPGEEP
jgi:hypothetical protein